MRFDGAVMLRRQFSVTVTIENMYTEDVNTAKHITTVWSPYPLLCQRPQYIMHAHEMMTADINDHDYRNKISRRYGQE